MKFILIFALLISGTVFGTVFQERYLMVEDDVTLASGYKLGQFSVSLIHWVPSNDNLRIEETVHIISRRRDNGSACSDTKKMLLEITGKTVTISEVGLGPIGTGVITGTEQNWGSLQFKVESNGQTVTGVDYFGAEEWSSQKNVLDGKGNVSIKVAGRMRFINKSTFEFLRPQNLTTCQ